MSNSQNSCTGLGCKLTNHLGKGEGGGNMCHSGKLNAKAEVLEVAVERRVNVLLDPIKNRMEITTSNTTSLNYWMVYLV